MKKKIKNWLEKHEKFYGMCLLGASLCIVAFGGAYIGANKAVSDMTTIVNLVGSDGIEASWEAK